MGEIADMMLDGTMCEGCGAFIDDAGYGIPRYCSDECARDRGFDGIQADGAGTFKKYRKKKFESAFVINMTHNGRQMFKDRKKLKYTDISYEKSKQFAEEVRKLATECFGEQDNKG